MSASRSARTVAADAGVFVRCGKIGRDENWTDVLGVGRRDGGGADGVIMMFAPDLTLFRQCKAFGFGCLWGGDKTAFNRHH